MRALAMIALLAALTGCRDAPLEWRYVLEADVVGATTMGANIYEGACGSGGEARAYFFERGAPAPTPSTLDPGTWCFEVQAFDAQCELVGRGDTTVVLPPDDVEVVSVTVHAEARPTPDTTCLTYRSVRDAGS